MDNKDKTWYKNKLAYTRRFNKNKYKQYCIMFNKESERDIMNWLESKSNKQGYIKQLIADDMSRAK